MVCTEPTKELVAELKRQQRCEKLRYLGLVCVTLFGLGGLVTLATPAAGSQYRAPATIAPRDDVDVVQYRLPKNESLTMLARRLWETEVDAHQVLRYNPALRSVDEMLPSGTLLQVPNYRDFPVEELAAY